MKEREIISKRSRAVGEGQGVFMEGIRWGYINVTWGETGWDAG